MHLENLLKNIRERFQAIPNEDRRAKLGTRDFISVLVFCFSRDRGNSRSLESIRKTLQNALKINLSRSAFWERLATAKLQETLEAFACSLIQNISCKLSITSQLLKVLKVSAVLLIDSSSSSLPKGAKEVFPAPRKNVVPAAIKLHLCFDLFKGAVEWFNLTEATSHDRMSFPPLQSLVGKLIIFDLGYWDYGLLAEIKKIGGFFLSRVKVNAGIKVTKVISGLPTKFEGRGLFDWRFPDKKSKIVEVIGQFSLAYKPLFEARVIGFWNSSTNQYHWYTTNLIAPAEMIYPLYRLRWQIELIFKAFKSSFRLADIPTSNPRIIFSIVYSALIANIIAHPVAHILAMEFMRNKQITPSFQRAGMLIANTASQFIIFLLEGSKIELKNLKDALELQKRELFDPNFKKRETTLAGLIRMAEACA